MPSVQYGHRTIEYSNLIKDGLKSHYISVEKGVGVILKGKKISETEANSLILKKAKWILDKLELVRSISEDELVTGSRIQYLGRKYYVQIYINDEVDAIKIEFTESKFKVFASNALNNQSELSQAFERYFVEKSKEKITPRIKKWSKTMGFEYNTLKFLKMDKRWGSCTPSNSISINIDAIKLPYSLIDYLIVHELAHISVKSHSKEFWALVSQYIPNWKELDEKMYGMKL